MSELTIRKADIKDVPGLEAIEEACFETPWSVESLTKDLSSNPMALYIVAEIDEVLVGYIGIWNIADEGHINNVAVLPAYRKMHIGSILLNTLIEATEGAGVKSHTLEVRESNAPAIALYEKFGFQNSGKRPGYYEDGEDAIIMWRLGDPKKTGEES